MKNLRKYIGVALVAILAGFSAQAADVQVKTSGPSGQGDVIYWAPTTGTTNLVMGTNGIALLNATGNINVTGNVTVSGAITAVSTNFVGNGAGLTNITQANISGTWFTGTITNVSTLGTNRTYVVNGMIASNVYVATP